MTLERMIRFFLCLSMFTILHGSGVIRAEEGTAPTGYPEFSWDTVPLYGHCAYSPEFFTPEHYDFMARRFKLVTFTAGMRRFDARIVCGGTGRPVSANEILAPSPLLC